MTSVHAFCCAALALLGCGPSPYRAGGVLEARDIDPRAVRSLGCLEVGAAILGPVEQGDAALLMFRVGNRCLAPAPFDLRAARFVGTDHAGVQQPLALVDPRAEIAALHVDAGRQGTEKVRLRGAAAGVAHTVCVDFGGASEERRVAPICFVDSGLRWEVRP
jgi:hypothetical protein